MQAKEPTPWDVFDLDDFSKIEWTATCPTWVDYVTTSEKGQMRPDHVCTFSFRDLDFADTVWGLFDQFDYCPRIFTPVHTFGDMQEIGKAIAEIRLFQHSGRLYDKGFRDSVTPLAPATIALYKTSAAIRSSFPLLEQCMQRATPRGGYVYLLDDCLGHYKIGFTVNPSRRIKQLRTQPPFKIEQIASVWVPDCRLEEAQFHQQYAQYRLNGEWFALPADALNRVIAQFEWLEKSIALTVQEFQRFDPYQWREYEASKTPWQESSPCDFQAIESADMASDQVN